MTPSSENREECIVFTFYAQWATRTLLPRKPTGKPLSQTCVASENGFEARLVFDEAISMPQRAFERRVDRHMTLRGWQSARFTLTPIRPRPCGEPPPNFRSGVPGHVGTACLYLCVRTGGRVDGRALWLAVLPVVLMLLIMALVLARARTSSCEDASHFV